MDNNPRMEGIKMNRRLISKGELLVITLVLVGALAVYMAMGSSEEPMYAVISVRNHPNTRLELSQDTEFLLPQNPNVRFLVENDGIAFAASDCPDQVCVNTGFLHRVGQSAACLPNLVSVTIHGRTDMYDTFLRAGFRTSSAVFAFVVKNLRQLPFHVNCIVSATFQA